MRNTCAERDELARRRLLCAPVDEEDKNDRKRPPLRRTCRNDRRMNKLRRQENILFFRLELPVMEKGFLVRNCKKL